MNNKQNKIGDRTESIIAQRFSQNNFWAYILPKKIGGQPFDIIACKDSCAWMVDAKHLEADKASFPFDRIEPNQRTSMLFAKTFANIKNIGFMIIWERKPENIYFLSYDNFCELEKQGAKSIKIELLKTFEEVIF